LLKSSKGIKNAQNPNLLENEYDTDKALVPPLYAKLPSKSLTPLVRKDINDLVNATHPSSSRGQQSNVRRLAGIVITLT
jgi:hypothetical protein